MNLILLTGLIVGCLLLMMFERLGAPTTLQLSFKGDVKRETQWLAQYGQGVATAVVAALIWQLDPPNRRFLLPLILSVGSSSLSAFVLKRLLGRVRPNREGAGRFLGPSLTHANWRESFPSSHSACAVAMSVALSDLYPQAWMIFWALALSTAVLRYLLDAHWPSDVVAGAAVGYVVSSLIIRAFGY
jgi:undecaprenyl-diphosphatase